MVNIVTGTLHERQFVQRYAKVIFRDGQDVLRERSRSPESAGGGNETDELNDADSTYLLISSNDELVTAGWRLCPTTRPYMLRKGFSQLLYGEAAPAARSVWEISRLDVDRKRGVPTRACDGALRALVMKTAQFAVRHGITQYVMVVSLGFERLLRSSGLKTHRFGPPIRIGRVMSVALWLDVDIHTRSTLLGEPVPMLAAA